MPQRIARAYHLLCAREDRRRAGLAVPSGVWVCARCPQVSLDAVVLRQHMTAHG